MIAEIAATEPDPEVREYCATAAAAALAALAPVVDALPRQLGHFDVTDDNVLRPHGVGTLPDAVIDFGDVIDSWAVGEIAVTVSSVLHHDGATYASTLPAIAAFDPPAPAVRRRKSRPCGRSWSARGVVLVLSGRQQVRLDDANDYASGALDREFEILRRAIAVPIDVATARIRHALGRAGTPAPVWQNASIVPDAVRTVILDTRTISPAADEGAWLDDDALERAAQRLLEDGADAVVLPALVPALLGAPPAPPRSRRPCDVGVGVVRRPDDPRAPGRCRIARRRDRGARGRWHPAHLLVVDGGARAHARARAADFARCRRGARRPCARAMSPDGAPSSATLRARWASRPRRERPTTSSSVAKRWRRGAGALLLTPAADRARLARVPHRRRRSRLPRHGTTTSPR